MEYSQPEKSQHSSKRTSSKKRRRSRKRGKHEKPSNLVEELQIDVDDHTSNLPSSNDSSKESQRTRKRRRREKVNKHEEMASVTRNKIKADVEGGYESDLEEVARDLPLAGAAVTQKDHREMFSFRQQDEDYQNRDECESESDREYNKTQAQDQHLEIEVEESDIEQIERESPLPDGRRIIKSRRSEIRYQSADDDEEVIKEEVIRRIHTLEAETPNINDSYQIEEGPRPDHTGRVPVTHAVPDWFPNEIKAIYLLDRNRGQLKFSELDTITRYRTALERSKRRKWRSYLKAGRDRFVLQKIVKRMRGKAPWSIAFFELRKRQFERAKKEALRRWNKLERLHLGVKVLDEAIDINFRQERIIFRTKLDRMVENDDVEEWS